MLYTMGCDFGDLDNDGWLDFYAGTGSPSLRSVMPNRMFRNAGGRFFEDVTTSGGFGHLQKGHGVAFGDYDNDGDQDIYAVMGGAYTGDVFQNVLFANPGHGNHWITLLLEGVQSNRAALGARIRIEVATAEGKRNIYATVGTGASFGGSSLQQEIGLGQATAIETVEVTWPATGAQQLFTGLEMNQSYSIREGDQAPVRLDRH
ncbi:MAG: CRTAC1 family protein [Gemmatimonadetes bacterium]|nr:CRTAC1 family protein [Gemmatimonadota bacterium]